MKGYLDGELGSRCRLSRSWSFGVGLMGCEYLGFLNGEVRGLALSGAAEAQTTDAARIVNRLFVNSMMRLDFWDSRSAFGLTNWRRA